MQVIAASSAAPLLSNPPSSNSSPDILMSQTTTSPLSSTTALLPLPSSVYPVSHATTVTANIRPQHQHSFKDTTTNRFVRRSPPAAEGVFPRLSSPPLTPDMLPVHNRNHQYRDGPLPPLLRLPSSTSYSPISADIMSTAPLIPSAFPSNHRGSPPSPALLRTPPLSSHKWNNPTDCYRSKLPSPRRM
eukprot:GHVS01077727.1.p1 GENE.GHVS01077727.1~~GHVS01077727.1.p1  ORF type:complete len:188 (+),score=46.77 GHVS01077727.1:187-750(+)